MTRKSNKSYLNMDNNDNEMAKLRSRKPIYDPERYKAELIER